MVAATRGEDPQHQQKWVLPWPISGVNLTADEALSLATVWACIDVISRNIGSCRWCLYEPIPGTKRRRKLDEDIRTWMLNTRPNPEMTAIGFREALLFQAIPYGNAYAEIVRDAGGRVSQLWPLMSDRVRPRRIRKTWELVYDYTQPDGAVYTMGTRQIFHVRGPGLWGLMGDNVVARAAKTLGVAAAQERFSASFFGQGAQPTGVLEFPGKLGKDQHERLKESWNEKAKGPDNAHKPLILESGMKFNPISTNPQESQLTESKKFSVEEICRWFGVPPHKVQHLEHATFSNIEHSSIEFVRDALVPWERRLCEEADYKLFDQTRGPWRYTEIDLRPLTHGDAQSRSQAQASWRQNGIMSANEIRAMEGLDDIGEEGDAYLVQQNMTTIERVINPPEPAPKALPPGAQPQPDGGQGPATSADGAVARRASLAAFSSSMGRYGRRLANARRDLRGPEEQQRATLAGFKAKQLEVVLAELRPFDEMFDLAFGRKVEGRDVTHAFAMIDRGLQVEEFFAESFPALAE